MSNQNTAAGEPPASVRLLMPVTQLHGYAIGATDGQIGSVEDVYFDDEKWTVRYVVVKTGTWLDEREVLISPIALDPPHQHRRTLSARLTVDAVRHSPPIDLHKPVARQQEARFNKYYGWPSYWGGPGLWGQWGVPMMMAEPPHAEEREQRAPPEGDLHLRSCREVTGYHLHARDGEIGHVKDFILDDQTWEICYLVVDTSSWWFGHKVLITPECIASVRWSLRLVELLVTRDMIRNSPPWVHGAPITKEYEEQLCAHVRTHRAP